MVTTDQYLQSLLSRAKSFDSSGKSLKALIYGESGVGKTVAGVRLALDITPSDKRIIYVDSGQGSVSLANHPQLDVDNLIITPYREMAELNALAMAIGSQTRGMDKVGCVILDEGSTISGIDLDSVVETRAAKDMSKDKDTPTQPDYNTATNRFRKVISDFVRLPDTHLIVLSHVRKDKDNRGVEVQAPDFMPKLSKRIREMMHMVIYMESNEHSTEDGKTTYVRSFRVQPTRLIVAKTRIGDLDPVISYGDLSGRVQKWITNNEKEEAENEELDEDIQVEVPETDEDDDDSFAGIEIN